jgi:hypothetical protein
MLLLLKRLPVFQFFRSAVVLLPARGRLPVAGVTGTRVQVRPQVVRSLQAATPLGVDRPDAASANTTGPLVLAGAALAATRRLSPPAAPRVAPALVCRPVRFVRPSRRGPLRSRDTLYRPDDARKNASLRRRPVPRSASVPGAGLQRNHPGVAFVPGAQWLRRSCRLRPAALATGPLTATRPHRGERAFGHALHRRRHKPT